MSLDPLALTASVTSVWLAAQTSLDPPRPSDRLAILDAARRLPLSDRTSLHLVQLQSYLRLCVVRRIADIPPSGCAFLQWTQLPLIPSDQLTPSINNIGVYGFSGGPSSPSDPPPGQPGDVQYELARFVKNRWKEEEWETTWFMNPPRLQSVKLLPHYHVFARLKSPGEV